MTRFLAFWGPKNKILHFDRIPPPPKKNANISQIFDGISKISRQKGLNNGDAPL